VDFQPCGGRNVNLGWAAGWAAYAVCATSGVVAANNALNAAWRIFMCDFPDEAGVDDSTDGEKASFLDGFKPAKARFRTNFEIFG
jgi:hypothetical protein